MKSLVDLLTCLLQDEGRRCGAATDRDVLTLRRRVEHEGESFITLTLATYGKDLDQALAAGRVVPGTFVGFARGRNGLPLFGKGFLDHIFDPVSGDIRQCPRVDCIRAARQIARFCSKVLLPCTKAREQAAIEDYVRIDNSCVLPEEVPEEIGESGQVDERSKEGAHVPEPAQARRVLMDSRLGQVYQRVASILVGAMSLEDEDGNIPVNCSNGPGATVEGYTPNEKWDSLDWHSRLEEAGYTRQLAHFGAEKTLWGDERVVVVPTYVGPVDEAPAKVVLVPKTLKAPRVIAVEPCCMQFAQQGLKSVLVAAIEHCRYTSGRINFRDQEVNQRLALSGSVDGKIATIDLKEASDRVDLDLVDRLFKAAPARFQQMLRASRSTRALLPDGRVIDLKKFASMGSALCFPVESLVFYTTIIASRLSRSGLPVRPDTVEMMASGIYVYGDDLVVPANEAPAICVDLEAFGLLVNRTKTFWTGKFRESCGVDAFDGELVTPVYLRRLLQAGRGDAAGLVSAVSSANQLRAAGLCKTAGAIQECVEKILGKLPEVPVGSPALGWHHGSECVPRHRFNKYLQRREYLCWVPEPVLRDDPLEGYGALAKCLRLAGSSWTGQVNPEHLQTSARPYALALKRRWIAL